MLILLLEWIFVISKLIYSLKGSLTSANITTSVKSVLQGTYSVSFIWLLPFPTLFHYRNESSRITPPHSISWRTSPTLSADWGVPVIILMSTYWTARLLCAWDCVLGCLAKKCQSLSPLLVQSQNQTKLHANKKAAPPTFLLGPKILSYATNMALSLISTESLCCGL